jgi:Na+/melibiose symporter-like transporter
LPLFVLLPAFYSRSQGLDLALIGAVLFFTRLLDAVADPLIGTQLDRHRERQDERRWIALALPVLAIGFAGMFLPPVTGDAAAAWLALTSMVTYLAYSVVSIAYQAWGPALDKPRRSAPGDRDARRLRSAGVLAASALLAPDLMPAP